MGKLIEGKNDLQTLFPEIAKQWDFEKNDVTPNKVSARSNTKRFWLCAAAHSYDASPDKRVRGAGCPYCNNRRLLVGYNDLKTVYPSIAEEWDYTKNEGRPENYTFRSTKKANWICSQCQTHWESRICDRVDAKYGGCPKCSARKRGEERHKKAIEIRGGITDPFLLSEWDYERNIRGPEHYTLYSNEVVYWICSKCGYRFKAKICNRARRKSCACCSGKIVVSGINDLATTHPQLAEEWHPTKNGDLSPRNVSYGMAKKVWWICQEGHEYQATILHRSSGTSCPVCNSGRQTSFAEQAVFYYLKQVFPDAINHYKDIFNKSMEVDIYIPSIKLAIEYDGMAWHKSDKIEREKRKYAICQRNGIRLLRLREKISEKDMDTADEYLSLGEGPLYEPKHLEKVIRFLLDKIDPETNVWTRRNPSAIHSKISINIKRDEREIRSYMTRLNNGSLAECLPELAKEWHPTKNGTLTPDKVKPHSDIMAWWRCSKCGNEYFSSVEKRSYGTGCPRCGIQKSKQSKEKAVEMIDLQTNQTIRTFVSISDASRKMGISSGNITAVCKGNRKRAGGYGWKYTNV